MPNIKSAKKRMELSAKARERNRAARSRLRTAIKNVRSAETAEAAQSAMTQAVSLLDRAARTHLVHPRKADRLKGRLQKKVNGLTA